MTIFLTAPTFAFLLIGLMNLSLRKPDLLRRNKEHLCGEANTGWAWWSETRLSWLCFFVIPLSAKFCYGRWKLDRIGWAIGQDGETLKSMSFVNPTDAISFTKLRLNSIQSMFAFHTNAARQGTECINSSVSRFGKKFLGKLFLQFYSCLVA